MPARSKTLQWWYKLRHWEFWSTTAIYLPIFGYYLLLSLRARSFFFFNASNPGIRYGGYHMESKWDVYQLLPPEIYPATSRISKKISSHELLGTAMRIGFPLVAKPDIGGRGRGVVIIGNENDLYQYHQQIPVDYLLQEMVDYPLEIGVFYVRDPKSGKGVITGIVEKKMLSVTGDGLTNVYALLQRHERYALYLDDILKSISSEVLLVVPAPGEEKIVVPIGNHARGAVFFDVTHKKTDRLLKLVDDWASCTEGFSFGRFDIRFASWDMLEKGEQCSVIELNGAGSEPTHMYDPSNTIWKAWKEIITHWHWLYKVSAYNNRQGVPYLGIREGIQLMKTGSQHDQLLDSFVYNSAVKAEDNRNLLNPDGMAVQH